MRKLASIQIIKDLQPIENSDNLLVATILGWKVVVNKKDNFKIGDKVVYFEIDSFLPIREEFEFLRKSSYKNDVILGEGFRLKSVRLRGQLSQGLILPLNVFFSSEEITEFNEDDDLTERLGVKKWEQPESALVGGDSKGRRPTFIKKTEETRIQRYPELLNEFYNLKCDIYATVKIDGSSHSIGIDENNEFHVTSHNMELKETDKQGSFWQFVKENNLEQKLREWKELRGISSVVVQGEWAGPGIQGNKLGLLKPNWYIFTLDENGQRQSIYTLNVISEKLGVDIVPVAEQLSPQVFKDKYPTLESLLKRSEGNCSGVYKGEQEGLVWRPVEPVYSEILGTDLSMKVINNKYLLKGD